jgi:hypothetical protein
MRSVIGMPLGATAALDLSETYRREAPLFTFALEV